MQVVCPVALLDLPSGQAVHTLLPAAPEYFPFSQFVQAMGEVDPPAATNLPAGHAAHRCHGSVPQQPDSGRSAQEHRLASKGTWIRAHALRGRIRGRQCLLRRSSKQWAGTRTHARRFVKGRVGGLLEVVPRGTPDTPNSAHGHRPTVRTGPFQTCAYNTSMCRMRWQGGVRLTPSCTCRMPAPSSKWRCSGGRRRSKPG